MPDTLRIVYSIRLRVLRNNSRTGGVSILAEWAQPMYIRPIRTERAPELLPPNSNYHGPCANTDCIGNYADDDPARWLYNPQPAAIQMHSILPKNITTTTIILNIQYTAATGCGPPHLQSLHLRLNVTTFAAMVPWSNFPDLTDISTYPRQHLCGI